MPKTTAHLEGELAAMKIAFAMLFMEFAKFKQRIANKGDVAMFSEAMLRTMESPMIGALAGFEADGNAEISAGYEDGMEQLGALIRILSLPA